MSVKEIDAAVQPSVAEVEAFLFEEADLLDRGDYGQWEALFTEDGEYWIPAAMGQSSPILEVSHAYEDRLLREIRIERFADPSAPSLQPMPRSSHLISNVALRGYEAGTDLWKVRSRFLVSQLHRDCQSLFTGEYLHDLRFADGSFRIRRKRVNLVNCDAPLGDIVIYL
jgi:3-phenylpropionate/cinnamic acid dioxygenase small subunit